MPEDPLFEIQYHELKERLFSKYRRELPSEFTKVAGGDSGEPQDGEAAQSSFTPASTVTEADENHDVKSLRRALDKRLFFLVRSKGRTSSLSCPAASPHRPSSQRLLLTRLCCSAGEGGEGAWHFPERSHEAGETMRQAAEGALAGVLTEDEGRQVYFIGHSPAGHGRYPGHDVFFHRAELIKGSVALRPGADTHDYAWITREELPEYVDDPNAQMLLSMMLPGP